MLIRLLLMLLTFCFGSAYASTLPDGDSPTVAGRSYKKDEKSAEEKSEDQKRAEAEAERKRKEKLARVIVLKWKGTDTDYSNDLVMRNVRSRISRPEAMFFPEVDLYQSGRKVPDRTVIPALQPAVVPDANIAVILNEVNKVASVPWNAWTPSEWGLKAQELARLSESLWFVDRVELREPLFLLYSQIGKCAENQNHPASPFFEQVGPTPVNYYWYKAALLAYQEPALMSKLTDQDLAGSIGYLLSQLQQGFYPSYKIDFELENNYNAEQFNKEYEIRINGIPVELDANAQYDAFLGRTDIYLKRKDSGHGLSERLELLQLDNKVWFVRDVARKMMGIDFIEQLFLHKIECSPEVDGNIMNYLAIYQKLHDKAEIYIAVPENGNPNEVWIWRYDRQKAELSRVGEPDNFPVHFAFVASSGLIYNGASSSVDQEVDTGGKDNSSEPGDRTGLDITVDPAAVPFQAELRIHYNRLMVAFGGEWGLEASRKDEANGWVEYYQHRKPFGYVTDADGNSTFKELDENDIGAVALSSCGDKGESCQADQILMHRDFNRNLWLSSGMVFGRDAGIGFGPRLAFRFGWNNMPHGVTTTGHFGWAIQPPIGDFGGRVRPLVDIDLRGGAMIPTDRSLARDPLPGYEQLDKEGNPESPVQPLFGGTLGIGLTF